MSVYSGEKQTSSNWFSKGKRKYYNNDFDRLLKNYFLFQLLEEDAVPNTAMDKGGKKGDSTAASLDEAMLLSGEWRVTWKQTQTITL